MYVFEGFICQNLDVFFLKILTKPPISLYKSEKDDRWFCWQKTSNGSLPYFCLSSGWHLYTLPFKLDSIFVYFVDLWAPMPVLVSASLCVTWQYLPVPPCSISQLCTGLFRVTFSSLVIDTCFCLCNQMYPRVIVTCIYPCCVSLISCYQRRSWPEKTPVAVLR